MCDNLISMRKSELTNYVGSLPRSKLAELDRALKMAFDLNQNLVVSILNNFSKCIIWMYAMCVVRIYLRRSPALSYNFPRRRTEERGQARVPVPLRCDSQM
jgi:hypothetical protein